MSVRIRSRPPADAAGRAELPARAFEHLAHALAFFGIVRTADRQLGADRAGAEEFLDGLISGLLLQLQDGVLLKPRRRKLRGERGGPLVVGGLFSGFDSVFQGFDPLAAAVYAGSRVRS